MPDELTVSAGDIARLAGVGRAAVSNWRRRHPDFPQPVGGTPASPVFALGEIETWLRGQGKLDKLPPDERAWQLLRAEVADDLHLATALADAGDLLLTGDAPGPLSPETTAALQALADAQGTVTAFEFLFARYRETLSRRDSATPPEATALAAALAGPTFHTALDPACATADLLLALPTPTRTPGLPGQDGLEAGGRLLGQDVAVGSARLAAVRLALHGRGATVLAGDSLLADGFPGTLVDLVVCDPPFHERAWGHEVLTADPRWTYGTPPRLEPELAWVQHALAHLAPGGRAVVLMPAGAAARRPGRRIRAELIRRGALRGVLSLAPAGVHVWALRRPDGGTPQTLLMADSGDPGVLLAAWQAYEKDPGHDRPGVSRAVPLIDLLDDEVDLTPARHLTAAVREAAGSVYGRTHERVVDLLGRLGALVPDVRPVSAPREAETVPVAELARTGELEIFQAPQRGEPADHGEPLLTVDDVLEGREASGRVLPDGARWVATRPGDVVVAAPGRLFATRVVTAAGALLGPQLTLLRADPERLDPWFLAGILHSAANVRSATVQSTAGTGRADVRRARVPRVPLAAQRSYGEAFRRMAAFESAARDTAALGAELSRLLADGIAEGSLATGQSESG